MTEDQKQPPGTAIPKESKPPSGNPWADDVLGSKGNAEKLTNAVKDAAKVGVDNAYVIGFHGEWGTGKTFLLERWCEELKSKEDSPCVVVYYNAWEDDFLANPLIGITAKLQEAMKDDVGNFYFAEKELVSMAKMVSKIALACGDGGTSGIMIEMYNMIRHKGAYKVNRYVDLREETDVLKGNLRGVAEEVKKKTNFPLVFVIDELDRCRPVFALEVLERVKHLFNVSNVVFVLGMNKAGLQKSIEKIYGYDDAQSERYLRRFFDREMSMPFSGPVYYCQHLLRTSGAGVYLSSSFMASTLSVERIIMPMIGFWGLTLREVESLMRLLLEVFNEEKKVKKVCGDWVPLVVCLMLLKVKNPALYSRAIDGEISCKDLIGDMMEMFCDEKNLPANPEIHDDFKLCQNVMEKEIYRLANRSEWDDIKGQMESIANSLPGTYGALAERTKKHGKEEIKGILEEYSRHRSETISKQDIILLIGK